LYEILDDKLKDTDLTHDYPEGYEGWYIGKSWSAVGDDETGKEFKESVEKEMKKIFGDDIKFSTLSEAWMG
jgi:hypothetical protein